MRNAWFLPSAQKHPQPDRRMASCHCGDRVYAQDNYLHLPHPLGNRTCYFLWFARCPYSLFSKGMEEPEQLVGGKCHG